MANEISWVDAAGRTEYALLRDATNRVWNSSGAGAFEAYQTANYQSYVLQGTEQGTAAGYYTASVPSAVPAGTLNVVAKRQAGGSPAETDPHVAQGTLEWNGAAVAARSDIMSSGSLALLLPSLPARGRMVRNFVFKLVSAADHVTPFTSGSVSGQVSRDGGAFGPLQSGAFTELGMGWYALQALTSGDLAANTAALVFTASRSGGGSADPRDFALVLQRASGGG